MATVTQNVSGIRTYQPFEGMSELQRMANGVPRGLVRFVTTSALTAKPVNDVINLQITCSLPPAFAYVVSAINFMITVDTATDWNPTARFRAFDGMPNAAPNNTQNAVFSMANYDNASVNDDRRILTFQFGGIREWFPNPVYAPPGGFPSLILNYDNAAAAVQAAGTMSFALTCYQYELNQAVRYPLNSPIPVGIR